MRRFELLTRCRLIGCAVLCLLQGGCSREDLSQYLAGGRCDGQGLCADGYECEASTWQCVKKGQPRDASGDGQEPDAPAVVVADAQSPQPDARRAQPDVWGPEAIVPQPDGAATVPIDACPPGGCLCGEGLYNCGGECVDLGKDDNHCGSCGNACTQGTTCCLGYGCANLNLEPENCGACGKSCPKLHKCQDGSCRCQNAKACEAGAPGECTSQGLCQCDGVVCAPGLRCVAAGVCG